MAVAYRPRAALVGVPLAALITTAHVANDAFSNILPVYLPTLQQRFGLGEVALASLVAVIALSANVLQAFMGALTDRWGRRRAAALGLLLSSVLMSFIAVAPTVWALVAMLAIGGLGSAIFHPGAVAMMRDTGPRKSLAVGVFAAGGALGSAIMPVIVLFILRAYGPQYVPYLAAIGVALAAALFFWSPPSQRPTGTARPKIFDLGLFVGPVGLLSLAGIMRATAFVSFTSAMPLYLVSVRGFAPDAAVIGATLATYGVASAAAGMLSGWLEPHVGRVRLVVGTMLLAAPTLSLVLALEPGSLAYFGAIALGAMLTNASVPLLVVSAQDLAPHAVGSASGMLMGFTWGIAGVAYVGFGALQAWLGLAPALVASFAFLWPAAALAGTVLVRHRARWSA
jgi:MFS transporter, FSR family, fosmidomycin resistance protein